MDEVVAHVVVEAVDQGDAAGAEVYVSTIMDMIVGDLLVAVAPGRRAFGVSPIQLDAARAEVGDLVADDAVGETAFLQVNPIAADVGDAAILHRDRYTAGLY